MRQSVAQALCLALAITACAPARDAAPPASPAPSGAEPTTPVQAPSPAPSPEVTASATPATLPVLEWTAPGPAPDWIAHRREGFQLAIPREWLFTPPGTALEPPEKKFSAADAAPDGRPIAQLDVFRQTFGTSPALDDVVGNLRAAIRQGIGGDPTVRIWRMPAGDTLAELRYAGVDPSRADDPAVQVAVFVTVRGRDVYQLVVAVSSSREERYRSIVERIVSGWRTEGSGGP